MHKLIMDVEMNNSVQVDYKENKSGKKNIREIIEIGAVLLDDENVEIGQLKLYVKPRYAQVDAYIQSLTGVTQKHVDNADDIEIVLKKLGDFIQDKENTVLYTWSNADPRAIRAELDVKYIDNKYIRSLIDNYVDFQKYFDERVGLHKQFSLEKALEILDIKTLDGAHDALVDALNTAKLFVSIESDEKVKALIEKYNDLLMAKPITSSIGSMFDFSQFKFE